MKSIFNDTDLSMSKIQTSSASQNNTVHNPRPVTPAKLRVNTDSVLFNPLQIGERNHVCQFGLMESLPVHISRLQNMSDAHVSRYDGKKGLVVLRLISYDMPVAQISSMGSIEVLRDETSTTTAAHIRAFFELACTSEQKYSIGSLKASYGVRKLKEIPVDPIAFPRVTVGMINRLYKQNGWDCKIIANDIWVIDSNGAGLDIVLKNARLTDMYRYSLEKGMIYMEQIFECNRPEVIQKFYRFKL